MQRERSLKLGPRIHTDGQQELFGYRAGNACTPVATQIPPPVATPNSST